MQAVLASPQARQIARNVGMAALRGLGRSRARRAGRGKWYFGKRVGIPPNRQNRRPSNAGALYASTSTSQPVARGARIRTNPTQLRFVAAGVDWLADVSNTTTLDPSVYSYSVNPAEPSSFPRLSNIAAQYQKYEFQGIQIMYTPTCATSQKGVLYIAPIRDPTAPLPDTVVEMRGLAGCQSCAVRDPMVVTISKAQLSSALNGFYCEAPEGVDPDLDDPLKTCGRIAVMTDGVLKADGDVGTIVVKYNFVLTDPKISPEGSALAGGWGYTSGFETTLDPTTFNTSEGKGALIPRADGFVKRTLGPVLVLTYGSHAADVAYTLEVDGVVTAPLLEHDETTHIDRVYWIPTGRQTLVFKSTTGVEEFKVDSVSTGARYSLITCNT